MKRLVRGTTSRQRDAFAEILGEEDPSVASDDDEEEKEERRDQTGLAAGGGAGRISLEEKSPLSASIETRSNSVSMHKNSSIYSLKKMPNCSVKRIPCNCRPALECPVPLQWAKKLPPPFFQ